MSCEDLIKTTNTLFFIVVIFNLILECFFFVKMNCGDFQLWSKVEKFFCFVTQVLKIKLSPKCVTDKTLDESNLHSSFPGRDFNVNPEEFNCFPRIIKLYFRRFDYVEERSINKMALTLSWFLVSKVARGSQGGRLLSLRGDGEEGRWVGRGWTTSGHTLACQHTLRPGNGGSVGNISFVIAL